MVVCMSERREGHNATRRQTMKRWKVALVAVLTIAMVMQSSNVQAIAEGIAGEGLAGDRPVVTDTMPADGTGTDEATGTDAATGAEDVTNDETAEDTTSTEATTPETDEAATDTEATEEESTDAPAAPEEVVEDTTETEAPAEAPAEEADTTVTLNVEIGGAKLTYTAEDGTEQNVTPETDPKSVDVPNTLDFKFTVTPDEGQQVSSVSYGETELTADESGEYAVATADLTDGEKIVVTTEAVPAEETPAEEAPAEQTPAEPEAPAEDEVATEPTEDEATPEEPTTDGTAEDTTPAEPEVLDSEEVVADVSSPAYEGYAYVGDIVVKVTAAEGVLPEGTTVSAYQVNRQDVIEAVSSVVEQNGRVVENSVAIDVTLLGPDGNVIQPDGAVNVCFFNSNVGDSTVNVYRVADDASTVQAVGTRQADASVQSFDVDHFSIYVVTEEGEPALATYNFHVNDEIVSTQVVKTGDTLYEPTAPEANDNGFKFTGWYTKEQGGDLFDGFGEQNVSEDKTVDLYAQFEEAHYVFFYDDQGRIFHTEEGVTGNRVDASAVTVPGLALSEGLTGWYNNKQLEGDAVETVTIGDDNIYLYPKIESGHWITFDSDGGTYIEPEFVAAGQNTQEPNDPTRTGYTFDGWKTEGGEAFRFGEQLSADVTLIASWRAGQADYTVIYWVENANDEEYSFLTSSVRTGTAGSQTPGQQQLALSRQSWNQIDPNVREAIGLEFGDIHLSSDSPVVPTEINGDGSTIVNVYYDRDVDTIKFYRDEGGLLWSDWVEIADYRIQAKVGAFIGDQWPKNSGYLWGVTSSLGEYQAYAEVMPSGGHSFYGTTALGSETATYYVEALPGQSGTKWHDGKWYVVHHQDTTPGSGYTISDSDCYALTGYSFEEYEGTGRNGNSYKNSSFYYSRNDYQLVFINQGSTEDTVSVPYETELSSYSSRMPTSMGPEGTEFAGWYDNPLGEGQSYNFDTKMPAHAVTLYAKWAPKTYTATVYADQDGSEVAEELKIEFGAKLSEDDLDEPATIDGKVFVGWATRVGSEGDYTYVLYNFDTEVRDDLELYPYYISTGSYTVTYNANEGTGTAPIDERKYAEDSHADVLHPEGLTAPEGKVFLGWNTQSDGSGKMYQPEDKILVENNVTLYAQWGDQANTTSITYIANYPTDSGLEQPSAYVVNDVANNAEHKVLSVEGAGFQVPEGYEFVGWSNAGNTYQAGATVHVDDATVNILTAQWNRVYYVGTPIQIEVFQDDAQIAANEYVTPDNLDGGTDNFKAEYGKVIPLEYTVTYTYEELNCADIKLTVTIPEGYAALVSSDSSPTTGGAKYTCERNGNVWSLDNVSGGSTITVKLVKLEADVSIEGWTYNGQFDSNNTLKSSSTSTKENATVSYKYYGKDAETGEYTVELEAEPVDAGDYRVVATWTETDNYPSLSDYCDFTVAPATLTVTTKSDSKAYDGAALTAPSTADEAVSGLQNGEAVAFKVTGSQTEVGWSTNTYEIDWDAEETTAKKSNYTVTENLGTLTVTKGDAADYDADVTISGWTYNGQFDPQGTLSSEAESEADGATVSYKYYGKDAETGEYTVELEAEPVDAGDYRVVATWTETDNYPSLSDYCDFTVAQRPVSATGSATKVYDGTDVLLDNVDLTLGTTAVSESGVVEGDDVYATAIAQDTAKYATANVHENEPLVAANGGELITLTNLTGEDADNYELVSVTATGTITEQSIDPGKDPDDPDPSYVNVKVSEPADVTYNGQVQDSPVTVTRVDGEGKTITLTEGVDYKLTYSADVNAGTATVVVEGIGNYKGTVTKTYTISPAAALIKVNDSSKTYGETDPDFTGVVTLADGNSPLYTNVLTGTQDTLGTITYSRTNANVNAAGEYPEVLTATVDGLNPNYTYDVVEGDFTIAKAGTLVAEVTTTAEGATKVYDGLSITIDAKASEAGSTLLYTTTPDDDASWSTVKPTLTNVGTLTIYVKATNPNFLDSPVVSGTVQVTPAKLYVTTESDAKVYDGVALTADGEVTGFKNGETAGFEVIGSQLLAGQSDNDYALTFAGDDNEYTAQAGNYEVIEDLGTLTVYKQSIDPTDPDPGNPEPGDPDPDDPNTDPDQPYYTGATVQWPGNVQYNGSSQKEKPVVTDAEGNTLKEDVDYKLSYSEDTTNVGTVTVTVTAIGDKYAGSVSGTYEITKAPLTIETPSASKVYDGTPLTTGEDSATVTGVQGDDQIDVTVTGSLTEAGQTPNAVEVEWNGLMNNYDVKYDLGTLTVFPQSIDPSDPDPDNPEPGDPDPSDPDPENPDQPFYTGVGVDSPSDVVYDGADHTWTPTVTDGDGNVLVAKRDYTVSYSTIDRTNVTGTITVTITGTGNFAGTVTRTYQVVPRPLVVQANDQTKVQGAADPALSSGYNPAQLVADEEPGWTGGLTREAGEAVGTYAITQGTLALEDNGDFLAANYVLTVLPGTLTITAAPAPDNPPATTDDGGDDTPTTPVGPTNPVPDDTLPVTDAADDATTDDATPEETVTDDENPLASGDEEGIEDNGNPLASGRGDEDCWVHWLILVGMILTAVYFVGVAVRRRKFTADLLDYEDKVLGNNRNDA